MLGWLADVFRGAWGLWYWNIRKTVFRLGGSQRSCPCQNPSDFATINAGNLPDRARVALLLDAQAREAMKRAGATLSTGCCARVAMAPAKICWWPMLLPLGLDTTYALLEHYESRP